VIAGTMAQSSAHGYLNPEVRAMPPATDAAQAQRAHTKSAARLERLPDSGGAERANSFIEP